MRFLIELEGPVFDPAAAWYAGHELAATAVGWSRLDRATFWRLTRTKGLTGEILPGAREAKLAEYAALFVQHVESDAAISTTVFQEDAAATLSQIVRFGPCALITLGANVEARTRLLESARLRRFFERLEPIDADPRRRPAQLRSLAAGDRRTVVAAGTDSILRAANEAGLFTVGVSRGSCSVTRLHQAGAAVVYKSLGELLDSLKSGAADLVRAGLLPAPLG